MPYATFVGAWDVASIGFTGRFVLQNIPILCNTIMLFHIDTCRLHPARDRLSEGRLAVASAGYPLLHQLNEWEIASLFSHAAGPTESTFDGQNLHPQPRYGGTLIEAAITESTLSPTNPLSAAIYVLDESRFNDEVPSISECLSVASLAISPSSRGQAVRAPNPFLLGVCGSLTLRFIFRIL